jgi:lipoyl(octanoyl) transferase
MRDFTAARGPDTADELWLVEHDPVFTQGLAGRPEHVLGAGDIPVVQTQRCPAAACSGTGSPAAAAPRPGPPRRAA